MLQRKRLGIMAEQTFVEAITDILVELNKIKPKEAENLKKAFKDSEKQYYDEFLMEEGLVDEEDILRALEMYYKVTAVDVTGLFFKRSLLHQFPKDILLRCAMIPREVDQNILIMVVNDPFDTALLSIIGDYVSYDVQFQVGIRRQISDAVKAFYDKAPTETPDAEENEAAATEGEWPDVLS